ncbi:MAG: 4-alpha-glucanotransferase [Eubacteriales bacterium]|nr:4-alpha-glucanotransferase [Eubacteriales bacterium]
MKRSSGVLLHISSLPGKWGIGKFGKSAIDFAGFLKKAGFSYWQVLPFNPVGEGNSPYMSFSAFAGYIGFIDPEELVDDGLIYPYEIKIFEYHGSEYLTDYDFSYSRTLEMLKFAYMRITSETRSAIAEFSEENKEWLDDYALFMSLREREGNKPFWLWSDPDLVRRDPSALKSAFSRDKESIAFWKFAQYIFYRQWFRTKAAINELGIEMIGDMPIYVSMDSSDVWAHPEYFRLDRDLTPEVVAGVPPDYFAADGQLWGNPIYDWDKLESDEFKWWTDRIALSFKSFDHVRIDHFRGFESFWEVDAKAKTAKTGKWVKGPAMKLFNKVKEVMGEVNIIAEDLGDITDEVVTFLSESGFPGMKVIQFGFDASADSPHLPHNHERNCIAYSGTHDNNTILGWLWEASERNRDYALEYCGFHGDWGTGGPFSGSVKAILRTLWQSSADVVIVPMQDICGFGSDARMNVPGVPSGNWRFRITGSALADLPADHWRRQNLVFRRFLPVKMNKLSDTDDDQTVSAEEYDR